ncbi:MAG: hypothetical protein QHC67_10425 [Sphingobium sp.]|nr:hypothetical protein [Sphingobium sp.]MDX3910220.1 hypothetical protein [Sphingobium sp.]
MKKAFWLLALGALASAVMAASIGRAEETPAETQSVETSAKGGR